MNIFLFIPTEIQQVGLSCVLNDGVSGVTCVTLKIVQCDWSSNNKCSEVSVPNCVFLRNTEC